MSLKNVIVFAAILVSAAGCKQEDMLTHTNSATPAPQNVSNIQVINKPGGAVLTYKLPNDPNLLYVKAKYERRPGEIVETKTTYFSDSLFIEGYGDTNEHQVQVISVGKNNKESDPQVVSIRPLTPPVILAYQTLNLTETFGGAVTKFKNPAVANLALVFLADSTGRNDWYTVNTLFTKSDSGAFSIRGFPPLPKRFAMFVRDRWSNKSDTIIKTLTPLEESMLDKSKFRELRLPTDNWQGHTFSGIIHPMTMLWDNIWNNGGNVFHTIPNSGIPSWFTFDLGAKYAFSRFKFYHRAGTNGDLYNNADVKRFEIWGSNNPNADGSWASWDSIGTFESFKPSGLPLGQVSAEDIQFARVDGEDFDFPLGAGAYRYLRVKILQVWGTPQMFYISEFTFWGSPRP
jgi:hypothetical protein